MVLLAPMADGEVVTHPFIDGHWEVLPLVSGPADSSLPAGSHELSRMSLRGHQTLYSCCELLTLIVQPFSISDHTDARE